MPQAILLKKANLHPLSLLDRLTRDFLQEEYIFSQQFGLEILLERMKTLSQNAEGAKPVFTVYPGGDCSFINTLKGQSPLLQSLPSQAEKQTLAIIKQVVLETILGLTTEDQAHQLTYSDDIPAAIKATDEGDYAMCFIIL